MGDNLVASMLNQYPRVLLREAGVVLRVGCCDESEGYVGRKSQEN